MSKISGIIIAKNAEKLIEDCFKSLLFCDEIILVDNGSFDETINIAKKYKAHVLRDPANDFSKLRNLGLEKAKSEWVIYVDSDERVSDALKKGIQEVIGNTANNIFAYKIKRKNFYLGNHEWPTIEKLERLFKREKLEGWHGQLHESPILKGEVGELEGYLLHYTHIDLASMLEKTIKWSEIEAKLRFRSNHPRMAWWRFPRVMATAFFDSYITQSGFKAGTAGLIESIFQAYSSFVTYARLWEMQQGNFEKQ